MRSSKCMQIQFKNHVVNLHVLAMFVKLYYFTKERKYANECNALFALRGETMVNMCDRYGHD